MSCNIMFSPDLQGGLKGKVGIRTALRIKAPALYLQTMFSDYRVNPTCNDTDKYLVGSFKEAYRSPFIGT
eukprot:7958979-Ditylum_brightwellii.AAC.1